MNTWELEAKIASLQSQLTAAHLEIGRLREAVKASKAVLMKSAVTVLDSCTCDGCNAIRLIDQALTPTTPNPVLERLKELEDLRLKLKAVFDTMEHEAQRLQGFPQANATNNIINKIHKAIDSASKEAKHE